MTVSPTGEGGGGWRGEPGAGGCTRRVGGPPSREPSSGQQGRGDPATVAMAGSGRARRGLGDGRRYRVSASSSPWQEAAGGGGDGGHPAARQWRAADRLLWYSVVLARARAGGSIAGNAGGQAETFCVGIACAIGARVRQAAEPCRSAAAVPIPNPHLSPDIIHIAFAKGGSWSISSSHSISSSSSIASSSSNITGRRRRSRDRRRRRRESRRRRGRRRKVFILTAITAVSEGGACALSDQQR